MAANDPVLERIATYPWPRGGVPGPGRLHPDIGPHGRACGPAEATPVQ